MADDGREVLLDLLLRQPDVVECDALVRWLPAWREANLAHARFDPFVSAIAAAVRADRMAWAFFSGYQGALCAGFKRGRADERPRTAAFCANESGRKLTEIATSLRESAGGLRLQGRKSWMVDGVDELFVLARTANGPATGPGSLAVVRVPAGAHGVEPGTPRPQSVVPELPHCEVSFNDVGVASDQLLEGDGYRDYARPFRLREDVFVTGCTLAFLLAHGHRAGWPTPWRQRCIAAVLALSQCALLDAAETRTEVLVAGTLSFAGEVIDEVDSLWPAESDDGARWRRDRAILGGGKEARRQRAMAAWARMGGPDSTQ